MDASTQKKAGKVKGRPSRVPVISPIKYLSKLKEYFQASNPDDYFKDSPMDKVYAIDKRQFALNLKIRPKMPKEIKYIDGLKECSQLQHQWMICAQNLASLEVIIQFLNILFEDTKGILTNCSLISGCSWNYDYHPLDTMKMLTRQFVDLQKIFQHKYSYYRYQISLRLQSAQIAYKIPPTINAVYINFCINKDTGKLSFHKQLLNRYTQCGSTSPNKEMSDLSSVETSPSPSGNLSIVTEECQVPGEEEIILPTTSTLRVTIQIPEKKPRRSMGKFHRYDQDERTESQDSEGEGSDNEQYSSARNSPCETEDVGGIRTVN